MEIPVSFPRVGTNIFWNCILRHGMWYIGVYASLTYVEEMILSPFLCHVNAGVGIPIASQSNLPFPWRPISSFCGGGFESFHFGGTMEANVPINDFIIWLGH